jgi:hypothetical protein
LRSEVAQCDAMDCPLHCTATFDSRKLSLDAPVNISLPRIAESVVIICEGGTSGHDEVAANPFLSLLLPLMMVLVNWSVRM